MLERLLCWFGIHDWEPCDYGPEDDSGYYETCMVCGATKVVPFLEEALDASSSRD